MVAIPGRERHRVAVQIAQQLLPRQLGVVFVKDQDLVPVIFIEGVLVIGDTVDVLYRIFVVYVPGLTDARCAIKVVHVKITEFATVFFADVCGLQLAQPSGAMCRLRLGIAQQNLLHGHTAEYLFAESDQVGALPLLVLHVDLADEYGFTRTGFFFRAIIHTILHGLTPWLDMGVPESRIRQMILQGREPHGCFHLQEALEMLVSGLAADFALKHGTHADLLEQRLDVILGVPLRPNGQHPVPAL